MALIQLSPSATEQETRVTQNTNNAGLQTSINQIGNASPKGVYATLAALQAEHPSGASGVYLVTADGNWYYWNGTAWTAGGQYQSTGIADGSISPDMTNFISYASSYDYFTNKIALISGNGNFYSGGNISTDGTYDLYVIAVTAGCAYWLSFLNNGIVSNIAIRKMFYASNNSATKSGDIIAKVGSIISSSFDGSFTVPSGASYIYICIDAGTNLANASLQMITGTHASPTYPAQGYVAQKLSIDLSQSFGTLPVALMTQLINSAFNINPDTVIDSAYLAIISGIANIALNIPSTLPFDKIFITNIDLENPASAFNYQTNNVAVRFSRLVGFKDSSSPIFQEIGIGRITTNNSQICNYSISAENNTNISGTFEMTNGFYSNVMNRAFTYSASTVSALNVEISKKYIQRITSPNILEPYPYFLDSYIYNNQLYANDSKAPTTGRYNGIDLGAGILPSGMSAKVIWSNGIYSASNVTLISNPNGLSTVENITDGSVHLSFDIYKAVVSVFINSVNTIIQTINYNAQCLKDGMTVYNIGWSISGDTLTVNCPDGTQHTVTDSRFQTYLGRYCTLEQYWLKWISLRPIVTYFEIDVNGSSVLTDNFNRADGAIGNAPTGQTYQQIHGIW